MLKSVIEKSESKVLQEFLDKGEFYGYRIEKLNVIKDSDEIFMIKYYSSLEHFPKDLCIVYINETKSCISKFNYKYDTVKFTSKELRIMDGLAYKLCEEHKRVTKQNIYDWWSDENEL